MPKAKEALRTRIKRVRFPVFPPADEVVLTGDFANRDPEAIPLRPDGGQEGYANLELPPGDPRAGPRVSNPFGSQICVRVVA